MLTKEELYLLMDRVSGHYDTTAVRASFRELMTEIELALETKTLFKEILDTIEENHEDL